MQLLPCNKLSLQKSHFLCSLDGLWYEQCTHTHTERNNISLPAFLARSSRKCKLFRAGFPPSPQHKLCSRSGTQLCPGKGSFSGWHFEIASPLSLAQKASMIMGKCVCVCEWGRAKLLFLFPSLPGCAFPVRIVHARNRANGIALRDLLNKKSNSRLSR